jgi:hypothetical protein
MISAIKLESEFNNSAPEEDDGVNIGEMEPKLRVFKKSPSKAQAAQEIPLMVNTENLNKESMGML